MSIHTDLDPRHLHIADYNYPLPDARIAKYPLPERDHSKLLLYRRGAVSETVFRALPEHVHRGELLVYNNTRVIRARLHFHKATGALIEVFCLEPHAPADYEQSFAAVGRATWVCLVGNLKKWKEGILERQIVVGKGAEARPVVLRAERLGEVGTGHEVAFTWDAAGVTFAEVLEACGELPIPPYLNRATEAADLTTYQTVYSRIKGSVAAPTAGLHFTPAVLSALDAAGVTRTEVTLHVGAGTFKPVKSDEIGGHAMHAEWIAVHRDTIDLLIAHGGRCTAVGTTSVRTLESLYYVGVLLAQGGAEQGEAPRVSQWLPYDYAAQPGAKLTTLEALQHVRDYLERTHQSVLHTATQIIIAPGYRFHLVERLITNFHQPQSTLLLLVSAFTGGDWRAIYRYALDHDFRFLSYGDSSLLERAPQAAAEPRDDGEELLPVVDEQGAVTGSATRRACHAADGPLHPVVHLHLFNPNGALYLQLRPLWKDIQPGRWDTSVGGHVANGETPTEALFREAREELGVEGFTPECIARYVFTCRRERELVYVFQVTGDYAPQPSPEVADGRYFTPEEIRARLGTGFFTPNFEEEWQRLFGGATSADAPSASH